ncbi:unnamed protein product (macronuclear) [Paramecium tetraurelia]|uniref:Peptidase S9 prolyl oligopeptidase catalytic domain-containing protein n=1 Tax=Paramecium tetraurelia TaxID=5888 RepID=A0E3F4_PARTE|nr:uncharacterized protein GSPATT00022994001 [Paramecium tetraurelia]CAK89821.1 unnamed protein product [Paramecium tetraurelia]|eukprot:XP_001457218.1 hypothetical protein (macronuclear) [Paramecium tetraurelia strain d4-2]
MKKSLSALIPNSFIKKYSFRPPEPAKYAFEFRDKKYHFFPIINGQRKQIFNYYLQIDSYVLKNDKICVPIIHFSGLQNTKTEVSLSKECLFSSKSFQCDFEKLTQRNRTLVIFSHANASDLGDVYFFGEKISIEYGVDFIAYDYTGYGIGVGQYKVSEQQTYDDLQSVVSFAINKLNYSLNQIILWGFSLGSGPATEIATRFGGLAGLILQAPIASIYSWFGEGDYGNQDMYVNHKKIKNVQSNILIIHGDQDKIVGHQHSEKLYNNYMQHNDGGKIQFILVKDAGHNDLQFYIERGEDDLGAQIHNFLRKKGGGAFSEMENKLLNQSYLKEHIPGQNIYQCNSLRKYSSSQELQIKKAHSFFSFCTCD